MKHIKLMRSISIMCIGIFILTFTLSSCGKSKFAFAEYSYKNPAASSFQNADSNIKLDGILDEGVWGSKRRWEGSLKTDESITVMMTSYFGADGVYLAFDVNDSSVYHSKQRDTTANSGIELYVSSMEGAGDINGHAYEIDLSASGDTTVRKYMRNKYAQWPANIHSAGTTDGEINTPQCKGYTIEVLLPYSMFGGECSSIYAMPSIIRTLSAEATEARQWYCFGTEEKNASWTKAATWWTFDQNGLVAHDVIIDTDSCGAVKGKNYVVDGEDYTFKVVPQDGYYAKYVKINGKNVAADFLYKDGYAYYTVENVTENLKIDAAFEKIPDSTAQITGKISDATGPVAAVQAYVVKNGYIKQISVEKDGTYRALIPATDGVMVVAQAAGYITGYVHAKPGTTVNVVLNKLYLGENTNVKYREFKDSSWDFSRLFQNRVRALSAGLYQNVMNTDIFSSTVFASANIVLPKRDLMDSRAGFVFCDEDGNDVFVALTMSNEKSQYEYGVQIISGNGKTWKSNGKISNISKDDKIAAAANSASGVNMSVLYADGKFDIWVNSQKVATGVSACDSQGNKLLAAGKKVAVGLQSWNNRSVFNNLVLRGSGLQQEDKYLIGGCAVNFNVSGNGKLEGTGLVSYGNVYRFYVNPANGNYAQSVTVNGEDITNSLRYENGRAYYIISNVTCDININAVFTAVPQATLPLSGCVTDGTAPVAGVRAYFVKGGYMQEFTVNGDGSYGTVVPDIDGQILAEASGYAPTMVSVSSAQQGILNIRMIRAYIGANSNVQHEPYEADNWDLNRLSDGIVQCLSTNLRVTAMNSEVYSDKIYVAANITLPVVNNADTRAGFVFNDADGNNVFVALTMSNEKGQSEYSVQLISKNGTSWSDNKRVKSIKNAQSAINAANSSNGVNLGVLYESGSFSIWLDNQRIATGAFPKNSDDSNIFGSAPRLAVGLQSWNNRTVFSNLEFGTDRSAESEWDLSQLSEGKAQCLSTDYKVTAMLDNQYVDKCYISSDILLPKVDGADTRAGFFFKNNSGNDAFVTLCMSNEKGNYEYMVQIVGQNGTVWKYSGTIKNIASDQAVKEAANSDSGVSFAVGFENGKFSIWVNNSKIASNVIAVDAAGNNLFGADANVAVGIQSWNYRTLFTNLQITDQRPSSSEWDTSRVSEGIIQSITSDLYARMLLNQEFKSDVYVETNITLPRREGMDTRAGIRFVDENGNDTFVALTMSNEKGQYEYQVQIISQSASSWGFNGTVKSITGNTDVIAKANSTEGIPLAVQYSKGKLTIWLNNERIGYNVCGTDKNGAAVFSEDSKVAIGFETWNQMTTFTNIAVGETRPPQSDWNLSGLDNGTVQCLSTELYTEMMIGEKYSVNAFASANIMLPFKDSTDTRGGFIFKDKNGTEVFVTLCMGNEKGQKYYDVQIISKNGRSWSKKGTINNISNDTAVINAANSPQGLPFAVQYINGVFDIWVNNAKVAAGVYATDNGQNVFACDSEVAVGLESWNYKTTYFNLKVDELPGWDVTGLSNGVAKCLTTDLRTKVMLDPVYTSTAKITANISLPKKEQADTRAGFTFVNENGKNVFVALCMNNEKGQYQYSVQIISDDGHSWSTGGSIANFSGNSNICNAIAGETGVPFTVKYANGTFDIWINGIKIATNVYAKEGNNNYFASSDKVFVGLQSWNYATVFTNIVVDQNK